MNDNYYMKLFHLMVKKLRHPQLEFVNIQSRLNFVFLTLLEVMDVNKSDKFNLGFSRL